MRWMLALVVLVGACAPEATSRREGLASSSRVVIRARSAPTEGTDARPDLEVALHTRDGRVIERRASAAARFAEGVAYVDREARLVMLDASGEERVLDHEVHAPPVAGARLVWVAGSRLRALDRDAPAAPITMAHVPGPMAPLAQLGDGSIALVGSADGGVAGLWIADARSLRCLTNCALRTGRPWDDAYVPPPASERITLDGPHVVFVDATGTTHRVPR